MVIYRVRTRALIGLTAHEVTVECHSGGGLPRTTIVGLADSAIREAKDRVKSAITNNDFFYPQGHVVINLAPGNIAKSGTSFDLAIALSILLASRQINARDLARYEFLGELSLSGELRKVVGALACALPVRERGRVLIAPSANAGEMLILNHGGILLAGSLRDVTNHLTQESPLCEATTTPTTANEHLGTPSNAPGFDKVIGQQEAKRALTIAAAGGHHALMVGPPGTGKTLLAKGFTSLMPDLSESHSVEVAALYSAAGIQREHHLRPPLRDPHHSASAAAMVGGGTPPRPGEVALAHHGILFLDELPHFKPSALDLLREPIETGRAVIARASYAVTYPCRFQLLAAMNPCPAGRVCREDACRCSEAQRQRYQARISGPLLDRIDIQTYVPPLPEHLLTTHQDADKEASGRKAPGSVILEAREVQLARQRCLNRDLSVEQLRQHMERAGIDETFLKKAVRRYQLSARSYHKVWRVARTIADMSQVETVTLAHVTEALSYRALDWDRGVR